tara:strand:- start:19060 stop:19785 length:726 start_codon:yes stop_codon:yes gene_type:complete
MENATSYKEISLIYDAAIDPSTSFLSFLQRFLGKKKLKVLDIGCGTGKYSLPLAKAGHNVLGVDSSKEMLTVARKNANKEKVKIKFRQGDARNLNVGNDFDLVVSCDCLNHFLEKKELTEVFESAFKTLGKRGKFVFQLCTRKYFENMNKEESYAGRVGKNFFVWEDIFYEDISEINISIFLDKGNNLFKRIEGTVLQRAYPKSYIAGALKKAGFEKVKVLGTLFREPEHGDETHYFVAKK